MIRRRFKETAGTISGSPRDEKTNKEDQTTPIDPHTARIYELERFLAEANEKAAQVDDLERALAVAEKTVKERDSALAAAEKAVKERDSALAAAAASAATAAAEQVAALERDLAATTATSKRVPELERELAATAATAQRVPELERELAAATTAAAERVAEIERNLATTTDAAAKQADKERKRALADADVAAKRVAELERNLADLNRELGEHAAKISGLTAERDVLASQLARAGNALEVDTEKLQAENSRLAKELETQKDSMDKLMADQAANRASFETALAAARTRFEAAREEALEAARISSEAALAAARTSSEAALAAVRTSTEPALAEKIKQLQDQVQDLSRAHETDVAEITSLYRQLQEARAQLAAIPKAPRTPRDADASDFMARTSLAADAQSTFFQLLRTARPAAPGKAIRERDLVALAKRSTTPPLSDDK